MNVSDFPISQRTKNILIKNGYTSEDNFQNATLDDLDNISGLGSKGILELREYLYDKFRVVLKRKPKIVNSQSHKEAVSIVKTLLKNCRKIYWPREIKMARNLMGVYGYKNLLRVEPPERIFSLSFFFTQEGKVYINKFLPLVKVEQVGLQNVKDRELQEVEEVEPVIQIRKPKSIRDFFKK